jgi:peptide deformylase
VAVRRVLKYPADEAKLRAKSAKIARLDAEIKALITDLKETLATQRGAGLAAPQLGVRKRVALVCFGQDQGDIQEPLAIINPTITERGPLMKRFDGCLSIPGLYTWDALRPSWLVFTAWDERWRKIKMRVEGADASVVDHEVDHLDGVLFIDRLEKDSKLFVARIGSDGKEVLVPLTSTIRNL